LSAVVVIPAHLFDGTKMKKEENEHDFFISQVESTSNYSTSYSSPYYTVRIYDTLIW
jgi:hypothetical protein